MSWKRIIPRPLRWSLVDLAMAACAFLTFVLALIAACTGATRG